MTPGKFLTGGVFICYPLIVYLMLDQVGPALLGVFLVLLLLVRSGFWIRHAPALAWGSLALGAVAVGSLLFGDTVVILKLYPTLISFGLLVSFAATLFYPPSMIERFAHAMGHPKHHKTRSYTRVVTMIWCGFFAVNGIIATLIAISGSLKAWTLYNGFISYVIMGLIIVVELIFRYFYKRHHGLLANQS